MLEIDSTDGPRPVKPEIVRPIPVMVRGEVYSRQQLLAAGFDRRRLAEWKKAGLMPLAWGANEDFFLADDIIDIGRQPLKRKAKPK